MGARWIIEKANGTARVVLAKPFVVMAARVLGPGPLRLRMVKLAHNLGTTGVVVEPEAAAYIEGAPAQPSFLTLSRPVARLGLLWA